MTKKPEIYFEDEEFVKVVRRCADVIKKHAESGEFTEKGIKEDGFELVTDFVGALGMCVNIEISKP